MDRKEFLKDCGRMGFAGWMLSLFPWLESCSDQTRREVQGEKARIGIIGTGSRGQFHIQHLLQMPHVEVTALCDDYTPHLEDAAQYYPSAKLYSDYRKLLEDKNVDGVIIATPLYLHAPMTLDALEAGKRVFCEKAMAYSQEDCLRVYNRRKELGGVLFIGQQRLFDPKYIKAMSMIHEGRIGEVVGVRNYWYRNNNWRRDVPSPELERRINWRLYSEYSRGLMTELACHQLQNGSWSMGMLPEQVMGSGHLVHWTKEDKRDVYDTVSAIFTYPNGVNMTFESVISNKHFGMGEQILGSQGTIDLVARPHIQRRSHAQGQRYTPAGDTDRERHHEQLGICGHELGCRDEPSGSGPAYHAQRDGKYGREHDRCRGRRLEGDNRGLRQCRHHGRQPEKILEESYYATQFALLADRAMHENRILTLDEQFRIPYEPIRYKA